MDARKKMIYNLLGKPVHVEIDRPIGHVHKGMVYPVNYGYIPNVIGGDGEELDVYLLGVSEAVKEYRAKVIAVIYRQNDVEDKLVASPEGISFSESEIREAVYFQEKYFDTEIEIL